MKNLFVIAFLMSLTLSHALAAPGLEMCGALSQGYSTEVIKLETMEKELVKLLKKSEAGDLEAREQLKRLNLDHSELAENIRLMSLDLAQTCE